MPDPLWTVSEAGTPAANGDYYPDGIYDYRQAFTKVGGGYYLFWRMQYNRYYLHTAKGSARTYEGSTTSEDRFNLPANPWTNYAGADPPPVLSPYEAAPAPRPSASLLLTQGLPDPTNLGVATPTLSWTYLPSQGGPPQDAYQIRVASSQALLDAANPDIWDSGIVESDIAAAIYAGDPLTNYETYFWAVRVRDTDAIWSEDW